MRSHDGPSSNGLLADGSRNVRNALNRVRDCLGKKTLDGSTDTTVTPLFHSSHYGAAELDTS